VIAIPDFDKKKISQSDVQTGFDNIENYINVTKVSKDQIGPDFVQFRHLASQPRVGLCREFGYPSRCNFTPVGADYVINESVLEYESLIGSAPNRSDTYPVIMVRATVRAIWDWNVPIGASTAKLCYYDGSAWQSLTTTMRHFGPTCGRTVRVYSSNTAPNYMSQGGPYQHRLNMPFDRGIVLAATFGGGYLKSEATALGKTKFAVAVNTNNPCNDGYVSLLWGTIELNARR
jgi:hypothetical protein